MTPTLVFDIETIPDTDGLKKLYNLPVEPSAEDVANIAFHKRRQQNGTDFLPLHQHPEQHLLYLQTMLLLVILFKDLLLLVLLIMVQVLD